MADYIPAELAIQQNVRTPLTLSALQVFVGGFITFIELTSGDVMVVNEASFDSIAPINKTASLIARQTIRGDVVICESGEIA